MVYLLILKRHFFTGTFLLLLFSTFDFAHVMRKENENLMSKIKHLQLVIPEIWTAHPTEIFNDWSWSPLWKTILNSYFGLSWCENSCLWFCSLQFETFLLMQKETKCKSRKWCNWFFFQESFDIPQERFLLQISTIFSIKITVSGCL